MTSNTALIEVAFRNQTLQLVDHEGEPYVVMRPVVEGMGLNWAAQRVKIKGDPKFSCIDINTTGSDGKTYEMVCVPLKVLPGWLFNINANRVRADRKDAILAFQQECNEVLWDHWNNRSKPQPQENPMTLEEVEICGLVWTRVIYQAITWLPISEMNRHWDPAFYVRNKDRFGHFLRRSILTDYGTAVPVSDLQANLNQMSFLPRLQDIKMHLFCLAKPSTGSPSLRLIQSNTVYGEASKRLGNSPKPLALA